MRLIDADKLILYLNDYALQASPFRGERAEAYNAIKQCIEAVEEQPTAYDIDKVVEELEELNSEKTYVLVTDGIIEMNCVADSYKEATNLFLEYLKNQNDDCIYEFKNTGEIYEYNGDDLNTVHFIFNKHYLDVLRSRK